MSFLIAFNHIDNGTHRTYMVAPTHSEGIPLGYSNIFTHKNYMIGIASDPMGVLKVNSSPLTITDDISLKTYIQNLLEAIKTTFTGEIVISKGTDLVHVKKDRTINISKNFITIGDRSLFGVMYATMNMQIKPDYRIELAMDAIGEKYYEVKTY